MRNVLLIEPNYRNKYPPIGLMKLATYHKMLGDNVVFFKGDLKDLIINHIVNLCISKLRKIDSKFNWKSNYFIIREYIKKRNKSILDDLNTNESEYEVLLLNAIIFYKDYYWKKQYLKEPFWDRVCVTTLFTFNWQITINTIEFCKSLVKDENELWVGGVMASVIPEEIKSHTNLRNVHTGLLNKAGVLDDNNIIIDDLPLDYSILDEIEYKYPENEAYYGYTTRGCVRKCKFCAVPVIEPKFNKFISLSDKIRGVDIKYGAKRNLLLLDNNVLASPKFAEIVSDIMNNGFDKKTKYIEPNQLEISINNLNQGINNNAYIRKTITIFNELIDKLKGENKQYIYNLLLNNYLLKPETATIDKINEVYPIISPLYEKHRNRVPKSRYVDFNQGVDARLFTDEKAKLLSQIPIKPLRIAFDSMDYKDDYLEAILKAKKFGIKHFSNYLLYNYEDEPIELYQRLKMNVELCDSHKLDIYSFPMKYHPIFGEYHLNRDYLGKNWNRKFIRAIQVILNATKGKIGKGKSFFYKAFGHDEEEFNKLLYMPETYLLFRFFFEKEGYTQEWWKSFSSLNKDELTIAKQIIERNIFNDINELTNNSKIDNVLNHYKIKREDLLDSNNELFKLKSKFDKLIKSEKYSVFESIECL
ncbi:MAG: hypothetical protein PHC38_01885 [Weeksellaceae bacterium]|nr:hypothetical protein [Weeksellaceae bacterium]